MTADAIDHAAIDAMVRRIVATAPPAYEVRLADCAVLVPSGEDWHERLGLIARCLRDRRTQGGVDLTRWRSLFK